MQIRSGSAWRFQGMYGGIILHSFFLASAGWTDVAGADDGSPIFLRFSPRREPPEQTASEPVSRHRSSGRPAVFPAGRPAAADGVSGWLLPAAAQAVLMGVIVLLLTLIQRRVSHDQTA